MKKVINYLILIVLVALMGSCETDTPVSSHKTMVTIIVDQTDTAGDRTDVLPKDHLMSLILGPTEKGSGTVCFKSITNVCLNAEKALEFVGKKPTENGHTVKVRKDKFVKKLDKPYKEYLAPVTGTDHSTIYRNVCQVANELVNADAENKVLILMSDLVEFSEDGNFYKIGTDSKSIDNAIKQLLATGIKLPKDPDFKVIVLFDSKGNERKDAAFKRAWRVWKKLFEDNGIAYEEPRANL